MVRTVNVAFVYALLLVSVLYSSEYKITIKGLFGLPDAAITSTKRNGPVSDLIEIYKQQVHIDEKYQIELLFQAQLMTKYDAAEISMTGPIYARKLSQLYIGEKDHDVVPIFIAPRGVCGDIIKKYKQAKNIDKNKVVKLYVNGIQCNPGEQYNEASQLFRAPMIYVVVYDGWSINLRGNLLPAGTELSVEYLSYERNKIRDLKDILRREIDTMLY